MKQKILIAILVILILSVSGIWVYMFFFAPDSGGPGIFSNFGQTETTEFDATPTDTGSAQPPTNSSLSEQGLEKLASRRVAAATFIDDGVRYVERGTGYVYEIRFSSGNETQITNTTVPRVVEAVFSESGNRVAMTSEEGGVQRAVVGTITRNDSGEGVIDGVSLPDGARNLRFSDSGEELFFMVKNDGGASGYAYNIAEQTQTELFSVPLSDIEVLWGEPIYVYTTPSAHHTGSLYQVENNNLAYVTSARAGLTAARFDDLFLLSTTDVQAIETHELKDGKLETLPLRIFLEKCAAHPTATSSVYCAAPKTIPPGTYPDDWYKGIVSFSDSLWSYSAEAGVSELANLSETSGEGIDVSALYTSDNGQYLSFINKNDDSLWLYELGGN